MELETWRKLCMQRQNELKSLMADPARFDEAMQVFFTQHTDLHPGKILPGGAPTFEDAVLEGVSEEGFRRIPPGGLHSLAWLLWHSARCEDITMNLLVAGAPQVLIQDGYASILGTAARDTGNTMDTAEMAAFNREIDIEVLMLYLAGVGRRTRDIARGLQPSDLKKRAGPERLQAIWDEGAVLGGARDIYDYWAGRTTAGLLLMPATRHHLVHLNEALELIRKL